MWTSKSRCTHSFIWRMYLPFLLIVNQEKWNNNNNNDNKGLAGMRNGSEGNWLWYDEVDCDDFWDGEPNKQPTTLLWHWI